MARRTKWAQCEGYTKDGRRCKRYVAARFGDRCHWHRDLPGHEGQRHLSGRPVLIGFVGSHGLKTQLRKLAHRRGVSLAALLEELCTKAVEDAGPELARMQWPPPVDRDGQFGVFPSPYLHSEV